MKDRGEPPAEVPTCDKCSIYRSMWVVCPVSGMPHQPTDKACKRGVPLGVAPPWNEEKVECPD
jgi:hypothetical protein